MQLPDYQLVQDQCQQLVDPVDASGVQGAISAMLAIDSTTTLTSVLRQYGDGELADGRLEQNPQLATDIEQLYSSAHHWLNETEFEFELFLPDDSQPLSERLRAMARWCDDFLHAFGIALADRGKESDAQLRTLLATLGELSRVDWDNSEADDQSEFDYQQLVEFIRMAVIDIHSDYHTGPKSTQPSALEHGSRFT